MKQRVFLHVPINISKNIAIAFFLEVESHALVKMVHVARPGVFV